MQDADLHVILERLARLETAAHERSLEIQRRIARLEEVVAALSQQTRNHTVKATCYRGAQSALQWGSMGGGVVAVVVLLGKLMGFW